MTNLKYDVAGLGANWAAIAPQLSADSPPDTFAMASWFGGPLQINEDEFEGNNNYSASVNVTKVLGRHSFQFGGEARRIELYYVNNGDGAGYSSFLPAASLNLSRACPSKSRG